MAPPGALVHTCKHLNLDLDEATCAVPQWWGRRVLLILLGILLSQSSLETVTG
jgi:hypothetical protein